VEPAPLAGTGPLDDQSQSTVAWAVLHVARRAVRGSTSRSATASATTSQSLTTSPNLLANPGAEIGDPSLSGFSAVSIPGWTVTGTPTVIQYGTLRNFWPVGLSSATPDFPPFLGFPSVQSAPPNAGNQFFGGGNVASATLTQTVDLSAAKDQIDQGSVTFTLGADLGGFLFDPSAASVKVDFLDANKTYLGSATTGPVTALNRWLQTGFQERTTSGTLPVGTQYAQVTLDLRDRNPRILGPRARYNNAYADNLSFTISTDLPAPADPAPPVSAVGQLDHVFMVYMENKGYSDIVGSPNAPFLNSLINAYGLADNYYGLTHGSLPNYYPIVGGTDFGITYNCITACIDSTGIATLVSNVDDAGKTWRSYAQGLTPGADPLVSSGEYAVDETPFPAFTSIANDPTYAAAHIVPLEQMAIDLQSAATAPNYAWFAADENFAGEGPVSSLAGLLKFAFNQIDPKHQYNVPALDQFLSETVPAIMGSAVWNDANEASVIVVTFDEDNNNLDLGFGNEGNHVVTVVIPNQAAIDAGMRSGPFIASNHYNHYSLLRMIEESLGLPSLTNNDAYAAPMNEFWNTGVVGNSGNIAV
ncbi:MAG: alkaline phosphatase family protein, partial [Mycobacteriaceae bacterium]